MKALKKFFYLLLVLGLVGGSVGYRFFRKQEPNYVYRTQPVTRGEITATISATGKVNAVEMVEVGTQVSGTIQEIYVDYNSPVKKGQLIALLDPEMLQSRVEEAKASLALAQAGVVRSQASVKDAERACKRSRELAGRKLIAQSDLEAAETALSVARATLSESNARVIQANASLRQAQTNLNYTRIVSPVDGIVISRQVDVGQTVAASLQTPTLFSIARDLTQMQIEASIDEADIGRIEEGQTAVCTFDAWPKLSFKGVVVQIRLDPVIVSNVVTYTVVLKVDNTALKLKPGMTANIAVVTEQRDGVLRLPAAALRFSPPTDVIASLSPAAPNNAGALPLGLMPRGPAGERRGTGKEEVQTVWLIEEGRLVGKAPAGELGVSDRTWVELVRTELREGQELAVSFSKAENTGGVQ